MKNCRSIFVKATIGMLAVVMAGLFALPSGAADRPLSSDDITLLLLGGSSTEKIVNLVEQRGVNFKMTPDLAKRFHDAGASDDLIDALTKAGMKSSAATTPAQSAPAPPAQEKSPAAAEAPAQPSVSDAAEVNRKVSETIDSLSSKNPESSGKTTASAPAKLLTDPTPDQIQKIIQEFARKEKLFKEARNNYTYHQINKVQELGVENEVVGTYAQEWDILYDNSGKRIERVTYAPVDTLKGVIITQEDIDAMRNIQPFVLTTDEIPEYEIKYLGHVKVDEITAYVFSIRPQEIKKGRQYFKGIIWVDDQDLQIVKSEGKPVPEVRKGKENLFPRFTTWREQIDGKYWFPTYTMADDTLYFSNGPPVHIKQTIRYTDYKQFRSKARILGATPIDQPNESKATPKK